MVEKAPVSEGGKNGTRSRLDVGRVPV